MKVRYVVINSNDGTSAAGSFETIWDERNVEYLAEEAAEHEFYNCVYNQDRWPKTIQIFNDKGIELGVFKVVVHFAPEFTAERAD